jgi:hypothetical protein
MTKHTSYFVCRFAYLEDRFEKSSILNSGVIMVGLSPTTDH